MSQSYSKKYYTLSRMIPKNPTIVVNPLKCHTIIVEFAFPESDSTPIKIHLSPDLISTDHCTFFEIYTRKFTEIYTSKFIEIYTSKISKICITKFSV